MEQKINIAELLKNCPSGMELDCTMWDNLYFDRVENDLIHCYYELDGYRNTTFFCKNGCYSAHKVSKCVIFPKGKTTWEDFHRPFKDGDVVVSIYNDIHLLRTKDSSYCAFRERWNNKFDPSVTTNVKILRFATEEEREKFFKVIKDNGYKWNPETKTLEKLCPFNAGDVLVSGIGNIVLFSHVNDKQVIYYHCILSIQGSFSIVEGTSCGVGLSSDCKLATKEQRNKLFDRLQKSGYKYNPQTNKLEKLIVPKFKVGDRVKKNKDCISGIVTDVFNDSFKVLYDGGSCCYVQFNYQCDWELVPIAPKFKVGDKVRVKNGDSAFRIIDGVFDTFYSLQMIGKLDFTDQDNWELVSVVPKFKVGDRIKHKKNTGWVCTIRRVTDRYYVDGHPTCFTLLFDNQNDYELVPNKFDITTLKPFDRVLARDTNKAKWLITFFSHCNNLETYKYSCINGTGYAQCIPYEGNEHLLDTTNDCDDYFKTWE